MSLQHVLISCSSCQRWSGQTGCEQPRSATLGWSASTSHSGHDVKIPARGCTAPPHLGRALPFHFFTIPFLLSIHRRFDFIDNSLPRCPQGLRKPREQRAKAALLTVKHQRPRRREGHGLLGNRRLDKQIFSFQLFMSCLLPQKRFRWDKQIFIQLSNVSLPPGICAAGSDPGT